MSDGGGNPCRHCLTDIPEGENMLVLAYSPFVKLQSFAEIGPIFLCAKHCRRHANVSTLPTMFLMRTQALIRG